VELRIRYYHVAPVHVAFLRYVLEACDGLAQLRTVDPKRAVVAVSTPPGCEAEVDRVMESLKDSLRIACLTDPSPRVSESLRLR
jgi:hypothetical protein